MLKASDWDNSLGRDGLVNKMEESNGGGDDRARLLKHDLMDKPAVIVGNCDLLSTELKAGSACASRLTSIRDAAKEMATEISKPQFPLWETILSAREQNHWVV